MLFVICMICVSRSMKIQRMLQKGGEKMQVIKEIWRDEKGIGTVEMILILVVLIGLVLIFKRQLTTIVNNIFKTISTESGKV